MLVRSTPSRNPMSAINLDAKRSSPAATISTNISAYTNAIPPLESWKFQRQNTLRQEISLTVTRMWKTRKTTLQQKRRHRSLRLDLPSHLRRSLHPRQYSDRHPYHLPHLRLLHHHLQSRHLPRSVVAEQGVSVPSPRNVETVEARCHQAIFSLQRQMKATRKTTQIFDLGHFIIC